MADRRVLPRLALLGATLVWGTSFVVVQRALADVPVLHLLAFRFTIATLLLLPLARGGPWTRTLKRDGGVIGLVLFAGFALQTSGLLWTTPSRSAFLTGLSVVLVPVLGLAWGRPLRARPLAGSLVAAAGLYVLYRPAAGAALALGRGDLLTLACAVVFAAYVLLVERAVRRNPVMPLAVLQFAVVAALALPSLALAPPTAREVTGYPLFAVLLMGVLATAAAFAGQLYAQRHLSAVEAGVILTLEPVLAAATSVLAGVERWTFALTLGGALVLAAMLLVELGGGAADAHPPASGAGLP
jgi:drug/metabolite transporter (DMT)-like permease